MLELQLNNVIGVPSQGCTTLEAFKRAFELSDDPQVRINIDSPGGYISEGLKIYDFLRSSGRQIYTNIVGDCHSMAVVILLAAPFENRSANPNARALIHRAYNESFGQINASDAQKIAKELELEESAILNIYQNRTSLDLPTLKTLMKDETIHSAQSLLKLGFISKINSYNTNLKNQNKMAKSMYNQFMRKLGNLISAGASKNWDFEDADGVIVLQTMQDDNTLEVGMEAYLMSGEASGTVTLSDGREVTVTDNVVTAINVPNATTETLDEPQNSDLQARVTELENALVEAKNVIQAQENELRSLRGSNYVPKGRQVVNVDKSKNTAKGNVGMSVTDVKANAREKLNMVTNAKKL